MRVSNIPAPAKRAGAGRPESADWAAFQVGESQPFPGKTLAGMRSAAFRASKKHGMRFVAGEHEGVVRVWRVS